MIVLTVNDKLGERQYVLKDRHVTIGRAADNLVELLDPKLSRHHCTVTRDANGNWILRDQESHNGTNLNGKPITETQIRNGDRIGIA